MRSSSEKKPRLPGLKRVKDSELPTFRLTARDKKIIEAVYQYRVLTTQQIDRLFFPSSRSGGSSRCLHRLKLLFHHGFLQRAEQPQLISEGRKPYVYYVDKRGAEFLAYLYECEVKDLDWSPRSYPVGHLFLEHLLATNDIRVAIVLSAQKHGFVVEQWYDEKTLKSEQMKDTVILTTVQGKQQKASVVGDGYFRLYSDHYSHQFLETDRGTVTGSSRKFGSKTWQRKVAAYLAYYRSGKYQARYNTRSMRIITVTTSVRRLQNLKAITEALGGKTRFWFTTFEEIERADVLTDRIWWVAGDEKRKALALREGKSPE